MLIKKFKSLLIIMDTNDRNNLSINLEEGDEKNDEQDEIRKYGKKKLTKRNSIFFIIIALSLFAIILFIYFNADKNSNRVSKELKNESDKINVDIDKEQFLKFLQKENEELKQKLENLNNIIKEIKYKIGMTIQLLNMLDTDNTTTIIINGLQNLNTDLEKVKDTTEKYEFHKDEEMLSNCLMQVLFYKTALEVANDEIKEKQSEIELYEERVKELEEKIDLISIPKSNSERNDEKEDSLYIEKRELSYFIDDLKKSNEEYFNYEDYLLWVKIKERRFVIIEGYFNTVVLSRFGFSWSKEKGFKLR